MGARYCQPAAAGKRALRPSEQRAGLPARPTTTRAPATTRATASYASLRARLPARFRISVQPQHTVARRACCPHEISI